MDINELKLVLELVQTVSGDAKTVVLAWYAVDLIKWLIFSGAIVAVVLVITRTIRACMSDAQTVDEINSLLGQPGSSNVYYPSEYRALVDAVQKLKVKNA